MTGLHLSHYLIEEELGRGGMGIVYRATDTKLNRPVALKVLPAAALANPDDRARFVREAQSAAQLHHPNIATVFGIDEAVPEGEGAGGESRLFIAMEYIEGETLRERAQKGPMKLKEAVSIAGQIAEALKVAHTKEIVHRDIKSANIMLTGDGVAKVLDFGLAKTNASTMLTRMGSTLGTVAYMSPEQARGEEVDGRSDLYSLGTVMYEMIAGVLPFAGDYEQAVLYGILNEDPEPLTAVRTGVPMGLEFIVLKLLAKEPRHRYQTVADLQADLETVDLSGSGFSRSSVSAISGSRSRHSRRLASRLPAAGMVTLGLVAAGVAGYALRGPSSSPEIRHPIRFTIPTGDIRPGEPDISSDGRYVAYMGSDTTSGHRAVWVYDTSTGETTEIPRSESGALPAISPDSRTLLFQKDNGVWKYSIGGGDPVEFLSGKVFITEWLTASSVVSNSSDSPNTLIVTDLFGNRERTVKADSGQGHSALFLTSAGPSGSARFIVATGESQDAAIADFDTGTYRVFSTDRFETAHPYQAGPNHVVLGTGSNGQYEGAFVQAIDRRLEPIGNAIRIAEALPQSFRFSATGHLAWAASGGRQHTRISVLPVSGDAWSRVEVAGEGFSPRAISLDGSRIATILDGSELVVQQLDEGSRTQISTGLEGLNRVFWSGRGSEIVVVDGEGAVWRVSVEDGGQPAQVSLPESGLRLSAVAPDGVLAAASAAFTSPNRVVVFSLVDGSASNVVLAADRGSATSFSPDSRHLILTAYTDDGPNVVIHDLLDGRQWTIPGMRLGALSPEADIIYLYSRSAQTISRRTIDLSNGVVLGAEDLVAQVPGNDFVIGMDVHPDGDRLILRHVEFPEVTENEINVVLNYDVYLEQIAPSGRQRR